MDSVDRFPTESFFVYPEKTGIIPAIGPFADFVGFGSQATPFLVEELTEEGSESCATFELGRYLKYPEVGEDAMVDYTYTILHPKM